METKLQKGDIKVADQLMEALNTRKILSQEGYKGIQYLRIITVLSEQGYVKDVHSHIQMTDYTPLYFNNGGAKKIYCKQWQAKAEKWIKLFGITIAAIAGIITIFQFIASLLCA